MGKAAEMPKKDVGNELHMYILGKNYIFFTQNEGLVQDDFSFSKFVDF